MSGLLGLVRSIRLCRWTVAWRFGKECEVIRSCLWCRTPARPLRQKVSGPNFNRALFASQYQLLGLDGDTDASGEVAAMVDPVVSFVGRGGPARGVIT